MENKNIPPESGPPGKSSTERIPFTGLAMAEFFSISPDLLCIVSRNGYFLELNPA